MALQEHLEFTIEAMWGHLSMKVCEDLREREEDR